MTPTAMDAEGQRLLARLPDWLPAGAAPAVLVTLWAVQGSTPRGPGARLLCRGGRLLAGTIGGGSFVFAPSCSNSNNGASHILSNERMTISPSLFWMAPNSQIGLPNWVRSLE